MRLTVVYGTFRRRRRNEFRHSIQRILSSSSSICVWRSTASVTTARLSSSSRDTFPPHLKLSGKITHQVTTATWRLASSVRHIFVLLFLLDISLTGPTQLGLLKVTDVCQQVFSASVDYQWSNAICCRSTAEHTQCTDNCSIGVVWACANYGKLCTALLRIMHFLQFMLELWKPFTWLFITLLPHKH